jgi:hypothetical protein
MKLLRWVFRVLQPVSPAAAAWLAERLFFTARRSRITPDARAFLATGRRFTLEVAGRRVVGWRWGSTGAGAGAGAPLVYLVHGWGSRGARLAAFVEPLLALGLDVVTYDALGQGESARGMTSMPEFARTLQAVVAQQGVPRAIVAHSMGCAGTTLAMSWGLEGRRSCSSRRRPIPRRGWRRSRASWGCAPTCSSGCARAVSAGCACAGPTSTSLPWLAACRAGPIS